MSLEKMEIVLVFRNYGDSCDGIQDRNRRNDDHQTAFTGDALMPWEDRIKCYYIIHAVCMVQEVLYMAFALWFYATIIIRRNPSLHHLTSASPYTSRDSIPN
jgi:hypothetical protein